MLPLLAAETDRQGVWRPSDAIAAGESPVTSAAVETVNGNQLLPLPASMTSQDL